MLAIESPSADRLVFCGDLWRDLIGRLPYLAQFLLRGNPFARALFAHGQLPSGSLHHLTFLVIGLQQDEDYDEPHDSNYCSHLSKLPLLKDVLFSRNKCNMPFFTNTSSNAVELAPRNWSVENFAAENMLSIAGCSILFRSFNTSLRSLDLQSLFFGLTFVDDLQHLPETLEVLALCIGPDESLCLGPEELLDFEAALEKWPTIDPAFPHFTHLKELCLGGPIVSPAFYSALSKVPTLEILRLDHHVPLIGRGLLSLITGSDQLPHLRLVEVGLCHCPVDPEDLTRRPRWEENFRLVDANKCLRAMKKRGIETAGNLQCAARFCDRNDGHKCSRQYAPI